MTKTNSTVLAGILMKTIKDYQSRIPMDREEVFVALNIVVGDLHMEEIEEELSEA